IAVNHLLYARLALADLDASGLPFALQVAIPNGGWFTSDMAGWPTQVRAGVLGLRLLVLGYASAIVLLLLVRALTRFQRRLSTHQVTRVPTTAAGPMPRAAAIAAAAVAFAAALSPIGAMAVGATNWETSGALAA